MIRPVFDNLQIFMMYLKYFYALYIFKNKVITMGLFNCYFLSIFCNFIYITGS